MTSKRPDHVGFVPLFDSAQVLHDNLPGDQSTEFSWGAGLVAPGKEQAPPDEGGMYTGRSPSMVDPPLKGKRRNYRNTGAVIGFPGEQIAQ